MSDRMHEILDAAMAIADERGLEAVSMRAVAERAGVTPMALYPHVGSKAELLDALVGRVLSQLGHGTRDQEAVGWQQRLQFLAHDVRRLSREHPWAATLLFSRPATAPDAVVVLDAIYRALLEAGVRPAEVARVERLVSTFVLGYAASEAGGRFGRAKPSARGQCGTGLPGHAALSHWLDQPVDWDDDFSADLKDVLRLIATIARQGDEKQDAADPEAG